MPGPSQPSFSVIKLRWMDQMACDPALSRGALRVGVRICNYINHKSGDAFPSRPTLAADLATSERAISYAIEELAGAGHLTISRPSRRGVNHYRPVLREVKPSCTSAKPARGEAGLQVERPREVQNSAGLAPPADPAQRCSVSAPRGEAGLQPNLLSQPVEKDSRAKPRRLLPADRPNDRDLLWARERLRVANVTADLAAIAQHFRDHHSAKATKSADWPASWRTWIGHVISPPWAKPGGSSPQRATQRSPLDWAKEGLQ